MLSNARIAPTLPVSDMDRAKKFYVDTLGFTIAQEGEGGVLIEAAGGTAFTLYPSSFAGTNQATAAAFEVDDPEAVIKDLQARGITMEEYDMPGLKTVNGIADLGGEKGGWFKDPEGNILGVFTQQTR